MAEMRRAMIKFPSQMSMMYLILDRCATRRPSAMILLRFAFENRVVLAMVECTLTAGPELSLMLWTFISDGQVIAQYSVTWSLIDSTLQDGNSVPQLFTYICV